MLSVEEARERMLIGLAPMPAERLPLDRCLGRVPAALSLQAAIDVPPFDNSAMDGFAVRAVDLPGELRVVGEVAAGAATLLRLEAGTAVRIMTGAPMPPGADTVVPVELATEHADGVVLPATPRGEYVRSAGHDTAAGSRVDLPGAPLSPASIAVLATLGMAAFEVRRRPRVAILSTGDELVAPGGPLRPGQIYDANSFALSAAVTDAGGEPLIQPAVPDDPILIEQRVAAAAAGADLLVVSGGVSVGRHDHVRDAIERLGTLDFWRIAVQPGKPLAFGSVAGRPAIGLPGNPVSALVTFELFVRPMLRALLGLAGDGRMRLPVCATQRIDKDPDRRAYLRVRVVSDRDGGLRAEPAGGQGSAQLRPLADANALLIVPEGVRRTEAGTTYEAILVGAVA
ncbi:MAG TPA: gephyrin-like molybdotransferase Glp [Candidatus Limnocylindria bacterium]|nr:gephyrin-like molybdotransferase Glp [Candidatus Limnocylindria bacterium]